LKYLGEIKELSEILLSKNRNEPRLKDIVNDESDLLAINRVVQEQLLSTRTKLKSTIDEEELDQVLTYDFLSKDSKITILSHSIQIAFDKEVLGLTKMNVDIEKILPFIDPAIVSDNNLPKKSLDQKRNYVALTFDDGPNDTSTKKLLGELKKEKIKATFFVLGQMVDKNPEVAKKIVV